MFAQFRMNLPKFSNRITTDCCRAAIRAFDEQKSLVTSSLDKYLAPDGALQASEIESDWFPEIEADVFLSHAHRDEKRVIAFAGYLNTLGITTFIDSCVWGYADNLLKEINDCYSIKSWGKYSGYDYDKMNYAASHVHMLLNGALMKMMDKAECLIFLDSPNSLKVSDISKGVTGSPWIYSEIMMSKYLEQRSPARKKSMCALTEGVDFRKLDIEYDVDLKHMIWLSLNDIEAARQKRACRGHVLLDQIYYMKGLYG